MAINAQIYDTATLLGVIRDGTANEVQRPSGRGDVAIHLHGDRTD